MYCTKCGKKLEDGEVCTCTQKTQAPHMQADTAQVKKMQVEQPGEKQFEEYIVKPEQTKTEQSKQEQTSQSEPTQAHAQAADDEKTQKKKVFKDVHLNEKDAEWAKEKGTQAAGTIKEIGKKMLCTLKKPVSHATEMAENDAGNDGLKMIVTKSVVLTVIILLVAVSIGKKLQGWIEIPYGNVLLMMVAVTLGADWLETALLRVFNGVFKGNASKNAMYAVVGTRAVYDLATILVTVILFKFVDVIALGIGAALVLLGVYVEFAAYMHVVEMNEDKKAIAFFIAKICTLIIALLVVVTLGKDILYIISNWNNIGYYMN